MRIIIGNIIKANKIFNLIENKDRICVGVSGGKDSLLLLYALVLYQKKLKRDLNWDIEIIAAHAKMNLNPEINYDKLMEFCKVNDLKLTIVETKLNEILTSKTNNGKLQCSLCSKIKKAIMVDFALKNNCNKIAMGHHFDDAIETLFMNLINEGRLATFQPKIYLDRSKVELIRPLILIREKDITRVTKKNNFPVITQMCPLEGKTGREEMKLFLQKYFYDNKKWGSSYSNFKIALLNGSQCDLWFLDKNKKMPDLNKIVDVIKK